MAIMRTAAAVIGCFAVFTTASAAAPVGITQHSIGGARLGLTLAQYRHLFESRGLKLDVNNPMSRPTGWSKWVFAHQGIAVYFRPHHKRAEIITTWNRRYRTAEGVGPCSLLDEVKLTYSKRLKPSRWNTQHGHVYAYVVGKNLMFTTNESRYIEVVGLYDGSAGANKAGGAYPWAGYITISERPCQRS